MLVRIKDKKYGPIDSDILDSKYNPKIKHIHIVAPGVLVTVESCNTENLKWFIPWNQILFVTGTQGEYEHELEQFFYLGVSSD